MRATPDQCRLILIDPKRVELGQYNDLPHLLTSVVVNPKKAANALSWAVKEMERRYDLLSEVGVRDITGYNDMFDRGDLRTEPRAEGVDDPGETIYKRLSFIVIVVDELNDLMMVAARDVEESIVRIAQMARAVGIHLVIATQRPSVERHHRRHQGQRPGPPRLRRVEPRRQPGHPRPAGRRAADRPAATCCCSARPPPCPAASRAPGSTRTRSASVVAHWRKQDPQPTYEEVVGRRRRGPGLPRHGRLGAAAATERRRRDARVAGDGARRALAAGVDLDAAAQAPRRLRPRRSAHGPARAAAASSARPRAPRPATC